MSSNKILYAIYGASGFGRGVMPLARKQLSCLAAPGYELVFIDDGASSALITGHQVYNFEEFIHLAAQDKYVAVAIANSRIR